METPLLNKLRQHLDSISEEQFLNEWNEIKKMGFGGPSVEDFFKTLNITPTISSNAKNTYTSKEDLEVYLVSELELEAGENSFALAA